MIALSFLSQPWLNDRGPRGYWLTGMVWLVLTLIFEFSLGLVQGKSWGEMFEQYTFQGGNIWPLVLVVILVAPRLAGHWRDKSGRP